MNPELDGVDHINVYSKGRTELGRQLTNFAHTPFVLEGDGHFASVEAYWFWLQSPKDVRDQLRPLFGFQAKELGRELRSSSLEDTIEFRRSIARGIREKIRQTPGLGYRLRTSTLPFAHYYVYGGKVVTAGHEWQLDALTYYRTRLQEKNNAR